MSLLVFKQSFSFGLSDVTDETEVCILGMVTTEAVCPAAPRTCTGHCNLETRVVCGKILYCKIVNFQAGV